ncbi:DNA replication/repair protein RecF [Pelagerythrobacter sp.]|uniref:DNA replication/repair protein RecF n=1 Tax=Pelagerythrobacter sp. TaxID=2800702 RepID=UPI0035ADDB25
MALDRITLADFRNHGRSELSGTAKFNLLTGENGAGKTNVLEALSLFAPGRGLRRAQLADLPRGNGAGGFAVGASLLAAETEPVRLGTLVRADRPGRRLVQVNGAEASAASLGEWLAVSWLTPAMDRLFADSAGNRRRFVDRMALALDPGHARNATRYEAALRERNRLLTGDAPPDPAWLDGVERHLAEYGSALSQSRARAIAAVAGALAALPDEPFARPALAYAAGGATTQGDLAAALRDGRRRDRQAGRTLTGPHRDDLEVTMAGKGAPAATCSTGEQKAMLIAITLAHAELAAQGRPGLLLLDEVAAHLDPLRREALFARLRTGGAQVWLTGTERAPFADIAGEAAMWEVSGGEVVAE